MFSCFKFLYSCHIFGLFFYKSFVIYFFHIANGINIFHGAWNGVV
jgi:hypothetical protein